MSKNGGFYSILNITKEEGKIDFFKEKCQEFTFFYIVVFGGGITGVSLIRKAGRGQVLPVADL